MQGIGALKVSQSAGNLMATVFWDWEGIILIYYKEKWRNITGEYHLSILNQLKEAIKEKCRGKLAKGVLLLQDNAPVHKSTVGMVALHTHGFESLVHLPYSPDLAPSDFHLFPNLKKELRGRKFSDNNEVKEAILALFEAKKNILFRRFRKINS